MHILYTVHQYLPEQIGGTELYTRWLSHKLRQHGHQVALFYRRDAEGNGLDEYEDEKGVRVWAAWSGRLSPQRRFLATFGDNNILDAFRQVVDQTQPDLVHIQHLIGLPAVLVNYVQTNRIPFIITLHDYWWICANAQLLTNYSHQVCDGPRAYLNCARCVLTRAGHPRLWPALPLLTGPLAWRNFLLRRIMEAASYLITPTEFVRNWYATHDAPAEKLQVVSPGLERPPIAFQRTRDPNNTLRFVYIGGFSPQKGVHILIEAFTQIGKRAELWIAGDGAPHPEYTSYFQTLASRWQVQNATPKIRFLGKLSREQVWETLTQVDVVVVPSVSYETFSFIISEAFVAGRPVVASRIGPLADRVRDGVDGLLVPPGDVDALRNALERFFQDPELLSRLRAGIRPVRTMNEHVEEIKAIYRKTLSSHAT